MKLILAVVALIVWLFYSNGGFDDTTTAVPWPEITLTNYRVACVDYEEPRDMAERAVPGLDELDQVGDSDSYTAVTADNREFRVACDNPPPPHLQ